MGEARVQRRLAAILAADVVGYSKLMGQDEEGTLARLKSLRTELIDPKVAAYRGRIFKTTGDGLLIEFPSAVDAVSCAVEVQRAIERRNLDVAEASRIEFRIGISLGDVIVDGDDLYGNGVNVAARLEGLAEPGGICISGNVREHVRNDFEATLQDLGRHDVRNIADPVQVYRVGSARRRGERPSTRSVSDQTIRFCTAFDGVRIAYATVGHGPLIVRAGHWLTHLEIEWGLPARRELFEVLAKDHTLIRYDVRGNGLSDWDVDEISFATFVGDLETVVADIGLDRFALLGQSQGAAVAAVYAARHPEKVTHLVLHGSFPRGRRRRGSASQLAESDAFVSLIRDGWGKENPAYVQMFGSLFMPDANSDQLAAFTSLQKATATPENAARIRFAIDDIDISDELEKIRAPTLVLHARQDVMAPFEEGRRMAASIRGARFVQLESRNHTLLPNEPAFKRLLDEVRAFLAR